MFSWFKPNADASEQEPKNTALLGTAVADNPTHTQQVTGLGDVDTHLFGEGTYEQMHHTMGAQLGMHHGQLGVHFAVWAPNASAVSVIGDFNDWQHGSHPLSPSNSGVWQGFVPGLEQGALYKYAVQSNAGHVTEKADPVAFSAELRPATASRVWDHSRYAWSDAFWMANRGQHHSTDKPISIYELHMGSWRRNPNEDNRWLTYREMAAELPAYLTEMGFTHVELMPVMEHPFDGSWGYQVTGYFAPTRRFGSPDDFKFLVDTLHQHGIGVILDWVPAHFPCDAHGLGQFDGTHLYEHADPRKGYHPDWHTYIFNYDRNEVQSFLLSNALFWFEQYHIDGLRVDAVASMLYLDYSRDSGQWVPNQHGGRENDGAVTLVKRINERIYEHYPDALMIAEESTAWVGVSKPTYDGGLGFGYKWDMGWMHDTLKYLAHDPVHRKYHHNQITFRMVYAFSENYVLPLSHDEVVHGKGALLSNMPGDDWQQFANLRLLYSYMFTQAGKKLLFMGNELAPWDEWDAENSLPWHLQGYDHHAGIQTLVKDLNALYKSTPALYQGDCSPQGFEWVDGSDDKNTILSYLRKDADGNPALVLANLTPVVRHGFRVGVPHAGAWQEVFNSDDVKYGGSGITNPSSCQSEPIEWQWREHSIVVELPPLGVAVFTSS